MRAWVRRAPQRGDGAGAVPAALLARLGRIGRLVAREEPAEPGEGAPGVPPLRRYALAGLAAGTATVCGAVTGGPAFVSHMAGAWLFGTPGGPLGFVSTAAKPPPASLLAVYGGLAALAAIWWRLLRALHAHPGTPVGQVVRTILVWAVPFLLAPPLFSRDVYSYAGQGALVTFHINPYHYGPGVLGASRFDLLAGSLWAHTPSPYGPTFLSLDGLATQISGHQILVDLILLRLLAVVGVALIAVGLPVLARRAGKDPAAAVLLGAGSPVVLATLIGGEHNDALMAGLLIAGLAAWQRWGPVPGIVLCALAAGVKAPAALGIVAIGWNWAPPTSRAPRRVVSTLAALAIGMATLAVVSGVSGLGWGWIVTLGAPDKIATVVTPVDLLGHAIAGVLHAAGATTPTSSVRAAASTAGLVVAALVGTWLLWRSPRTGPVRALGLTLVVLTLLGPILWAWYVTWGVAVLAPVASGLLRRMLVWLVVAETLIGAASVHTLFAALGHYGPVGALMIVAGVAAAVLAALSARYAAPRRLPTGARGGTAEVAGMPVVQHPPT